MRLAGDHLSTSSDANITGNAIYKTHDIFYFVVKKITENGGAEGELRGLIQEQMFGLRFLRSPFSFLL